MASDMHSIDVTTSVNRVAAEPEVERSPGTLAEAIGLQAIEGNPLTPDEIAVFEMFDRENWPFEKRRAYILDGIKAETSAIIE